MKGIALIFFVVALSKMLFADTFFLEHPESGRRFGPYKFKDGADIIIGNTSLKLRRETVESLQQETPAHEDNKMLLKTERGEWVSGVLEHKSMGELTLRDGTDIRKFRIRDLSKGDREWLRETGLEPKPVMQDAPIRDVAMSITDIYEAKNQIIGHIIKIPFDFRRGTQNDKGYYVFQFGSSFDRAAIIVVPADGYKVWLQIDEKDLIAERGSKCGKYIYVKVERGDLRNQYSGDSFSGLVLKCIGRRIEDGRYVWLTKDEKTKVERSQFGL